MTVESAVEILIRSHKENWDLDESTPDDRLWASPLGRFVSAFGELAPHPRPMQWLGLFTARRAVACWQLYCDGTKPIDGIHAAERFLAESASHIILRDFTEPAVPAFRGVPIVDCRECDTSCAADAVAHLARLIVNGNPRDLAICLSSADCAFDQSPLGQQDEFRRWLVEVAVPVAATGRDLTEEEASRFQAW